MIVWCLFELCLFVFSFNFQTLYAQYRNANPTFKLLTNEYVTQKKKMDKRMLNAAKSSQKKKRQPKKKNVKK